MRSEPIFWNVTCSQNGAVQWTPASGRITSPVAVEALYENNIEEPLEQGGKPPGGWGFYFD